MMLTEPSDVLQDTAHAIPRADAIESAGDVPAAVRARVLSPDDRRARAAAGQAGAVDGPGAHADAARARARHDPDRRRARLGRHRLPLPQGLHLALPARRRARTRRANRAWRIAHHVDAAP